MHSQCLLAALISVPQPLLLIIEEELLKTGEGPFLPVTLESELELCPTPKQANQCLKALPKLNPLFHFNLC
ncbi:hypothetical protein OIU77_013511 [Salix suchowensis]|uniref:Uncharacterized protein n=1 Tax=Salix suchowensis TaxID=1278906 RepID=A0ABQ8ZU33_9ROSI|nr:hypothetical protein OIU77_013511 [Salix suchowensis]